MANLLKGALVLVGISFLVYGTEDIYPTPLKVSKVDPKAKVVEPDRR